MKKVLLLVALLTGICFFVNAEVRYDAEKNLIWAHDFQKDQPLLLKKLLLMNNMNEWGKISYDKKTDSYTINANLTIGKNDGTETYMQIGTKDNPKQTLVLNGNLVVYPFFIRGVNKEKNSTVVKYCTNRLTLGNPDDNNIKATLKIVSKYPKQAHTISIGRAILDPKNGRYKYNYFGDGGELCVYNSTIASAKDGFANSIGVPWVAMPGRKIIIKNSVISGFRKTPLYGLQGRYGTLENSIFKNSAMGIINSNSPIKAKGCTFQDISLALYDIGGVLKADLSECIFKNNNRNWFLSRGKIRLIDCEIGPSKKGDVLKKGKLYSRKEKKQIDTYPEVFSLRHVIVKVVDASGKPVKDATVKIISEQGDLSTFSPAVSKTDADGKTPKEGKAILLTEYKLKATDNAKQPKKTTYSYEIVVQSANVTPVSLKEFKPTKSWQEVTVNLK